MGQSLFMAGVISTTAALILCANVAIAGGEPGRGKQVFNKCKTCHHLTKNKHKVGPTLVGVAGRPAATAKDGKGKLFKYSKGMKQAGADGIVWTAENLDKFLTKPRLFVPKTKMTFPGLKKPADRADVIAYLKSQ